MLHAKMLIVPGRFASIGSQNLTDQGRRNREATVAFTGRGDVGEVAGPAMHWAEQAVPITPDRIKAMERLIGPLREQFAAAKEAAMRIDRLLRVESGATAIAGRRRRRSGQRRAGRDGGGEEMQERYPGVEDRAASWDEEQEEELVGQLTAGINPDEDRLPEPEIRALEEDYRAEEEPAEQVEEHADEEREDEGLTEDDGADVPGVQPCGAGCPPLLPVGGPERLESFRRAIGRARTAREVVEAQVTLLGEPGRRKASLIGPPAANLTSWVVEGREVTLKSKHRYMCILERVCTWGWARVAQTRISIIAPRLTLSTPVVLGDSLNHRFAFEAIWGSASDVQGNLKVTAYAARDRKNRLPLLTIDCRFGLDTLHIFNARVNEGLRIARRRKAERLREWLLDNRDQFGHAMLPQILSPFKYNAKLYGERADRFFGRIGSPVSLRLAVVDGHEVLVARRL